MSSSKTPKNAPETTGDVSKNVKAEARPSKTALGEALRANLRRRKDQARAKSTETSTGTEDAGDERR